MVSMSNKYFNFTLNYSIGLDGLSILFIILSTSNSYKCLSSESINTDEKCSLFIIFNRISINKCIFCNGIVLKFLCII
jgi:NADH:ubiquinone oxidoreductase subunit 4 (subunit M)